MSWEATAPLDTVSEVIRGVTFAKADSSNIEEENTLPILRAGNIQQQIILDEGLVYVSKNKIKNHQILRSNDIVMCTSSGSSKLVGKSARIEKNWHGSFGAFCAGIRPNPEIVSPSFLFHFLQSSLFRRWTKSSDGVGIKNIRSSDLKSFPIPLPPLPEQKRIAAILDQADALRRQRQAALDRLNTLGQSIFYDMFGDIKTGNDTLLDIADLQIGHPFKSKNYVEQETSGKLCRGANVAPNKLDWKDTKYYPEDMLDKLDSYRLFEGDIIVAMDRPWISNGFKNARVKTTDLPSYLVQRVARIRATNKYDEAFLFALINHPSFTRHCKPTETTIPHISPKDFKTFQFALPDKNMRELFMIKISELEKALVGFRSQLKTLNILFTSLQQRAFRGEL